MCLAVNGLNEDRNKEGLIISSINVERDES